MENWRQHRIEIWFVSYTTKYYVMSERKEKAHRVQNIMHDPRVLFTINLKSFEGSARLVDKPTEYKVAEQISDLMHRKLVGVMV